jgi:serine protease Do
VRAGVVNIQVSKKVKNVGLERFGRGNPFGDRNPFGDFFGPFERNQPDRKQQGVGSGFIMSKEGYILTNNHVVEDAEQIKVKLAGGKEFDGKIVGRDPKTDLALVKIAGDSDLQPLKLGNSDDLKVGSWVVAVGSPFGLEQTVTAGIVSAKGRVIGSGPYDNFIQTDASINPGNSGGPLFNMEGKVVGINTAIVSQGQGIGFAIPISMAKNILPDLKAKGKVTRGMLGITVQDISDDIAITLKLKDKDRSGILIADVSEGDPADKAGLKSGDIVTEINGKPVKDTHGLLLMIAEFPVGETIKVKIVRDGQEKVFPITIAERTEKSETAFAQQSGEAFGMTVQEITPEIAQHLGLSIKKGIIVVDVQEGSVAEEVGIQPQDIILSVNKIKITTMKEYQKEIAKAGEKGSILLLIKRGKAAFYVPLMR